MADWSRDEETVGELISRARLKLGKSQYALADALREASQRSDGAPDRGMVARWKPGGGYRRLTGEPTLRRSSRFRPHNSTRRRASPGLAVAIVPSQQNGCPLMTG